MKCQVRSRIPFAFIAIQLSACASVVRIAAQGSIAGYAIDGPVDSQIAKDYLEGRAVPADLEATRQHFLTSGETPTRDDLASISRDFSPDVATLLFIEAMSTSSESRELRRRFDAELTHVRAVGVDVGRPQMPDDLLILFVPGWFYVTHGSETNADYRKQRELFERWGVAHRLVPIDENGTIEANARIVADAIREASKPKVFIVSASKSAGEVALALGRELSSFEAASVVGWLSIGGVVRGSPVADRVLEPDLCWFVELKLALEGFDLEGAKSMRTAHARKTFDRLRFPSHIRVVTFVPVPLSGHISERASFGYDQMLDLGPNDGLTLLVDELIPGGVPLLAPGVDHFLGPEDQTIWSTALFRVVVDDLENSEPG